MVELSRLGLSGWFKSSMQLGQYVLVCTSLKDLIEFKADLHSIPNACLVHYVQLDISSVKEEKVNYNV